MITLLPGILDSMDAGVLALDLDNRILFLNRPAARLLQTEPDIWTDRPVAELRSLVEPHLIDADVLTEALDAIGSPKTKRSVEFDWRHGDEYLNLRGDSSALYDAEGVLRGRVFIFRDISREKEIDRMKSEFIAVASHELRTPMTSIKGSVDLILSGLAGPTSPDTQELLEISKKSCDRLIRMINEILDLAKIEAGQIKMEMVKADLTDAVERSMRGLRSLADRTNVSLRLVRPDSLPQVEVDKDRIEQVVTNLLSNAIKFSPAQGEVRVELTAEDGWVKCAVVDQGCGISEDDLPKVFGKFQQVGDQRKGGTGLGLAITQAFINEHRGRIWAESEVGVGSRFIFALRVANTSAAEH